MFDEKFWLAIAFFAFVYLIAKYVFPHVIKGLDNSAKKIADDLEAAKILKEKAEKLLHNAEQFYKESLTYAEKLKNDAAIEAKNIADKSSQALAVEIEKRTTAALNRIKLEEERMVRQIKLQIVENAIKQLSNSADLKKDAQEKLIDKSIKNLETIQ